MQAPSDAGHSHFLASGQLFGGEATIPLYRDNCGCARATVAAMTDWVPLLLTGLGAGVLGSVITTNGSQARQRREAHGVGGKDYKVMWSETTD